VRDTSGTAVASPRQVIQARGHTGTNYLIPTALTRSAVGHGYGYAVMVARQESCSLLSDLYALCLYPQWWWGPPASAPISR
jgi:hypothetical protein